MSQLMVSMSRSPRFWLALAFFTLPLLATVVPGMAGGAPSSSDGATLEVAYDGPWTPVPLDATTDATLIVRKVAYPRNTTETFTFTGDVAGTIPSGGTLTVTDVPVPGTYTSTEIVPSGWNLESIQCDDGSHYWGDTATFLPRPAQTLQCTFYNLEQWSQPCEELTGLWPYGPSHAVDVDGTTAFMGSGAALVSVDVSAPSSPLELDSVAFDQVVRGVAANGTRVYVSTALGYDGSLVVLDATSPGALQQLGEIWVPDPGGVAIAGTYAYVASSTWDLTVVDVVDPANPALVTHLSLPGYARDVSLSGNLAYLASEHYGLRIVDVSSPSSPSEIGALPLAGSVSGIDVEGQFAYVACGDDGLRIVDVSNPAAPVEVGSITTDRAKDVDVVGPFAYVADDWWGLKVVDVANPASPVSVGGFYSAGSSQTIVVDGNLAFISAGGYGLQILGVSIPSAPVGLGALDFPNEAYDVDLIGDYAYLSLGYEGDLLVLDVSDPADPRESIYLNTSWSTESLQAVGSYAYVAAGGAGLRVLDISNPAMPVDVGDVDTPGWGIQVAVANDFAYLADGSGGLRVIDVSTPWSPFEVASAPTTSYALDVESDGTHAWVVTSANGVEVFDVSNPASPLPIGVINPPGTERVLAMQGPLLFVGGSYGLRLFDVANPASPNEIGSYNAYVNITALALGGNLVYALTGTYLVTYDISDPTAPIMVDAVLSEAFPTAIATGRSRTFLAQQEIELEIMSPCGLIMADDFETGDTRYW